MAGTTTATDFRNTILNGDSVQLMRALPRNSVDFILTDPPYLGQHSFNVTQAARELGLTRPALYRRMARYRL